MKRSIALLLCAAFGLAATAQTDNREKLIDELVGIKDESEKWY